MNRGEIWTVANSPDYAGKPRPVVIVQNDAFPDTESITICLLTSVKSYAPFFRAEIEPTQTNGLRSPSRLMTDKIVTVPKTKLGRKIGALSHADIQRMNQSILLFLGLADTNNDTMVGA
jgi:mRNA interferase MazF